MSSATAIAAVTQTIVNLLDGWLRKDPELADARVTAVPPDKARDGVASNQLNVFLYQTAINPAWRNMDTPRQVRPNERATAALPLNLHYLFTAYGRENSDVLGHRVLGRAMSFLHDFPLLGPADIESALPGSELGLQAERVRITPQALSVDEMSKLWTTFQSQYRISTAYEVAVVLVDSMRETRSALPVLTRGPDDQGVRTVGGIVPPFPTLDSISIPDSRPNAQLGDRLVLNGHHLAGDGLSIVFASPRMEQPKRLAPEAGATATRLEVNLPNDIAAKTSWPPGLYTVSVEVTSIGPPQRVVSSDEAPLRVSPVLGGVPLSVPIVAGSATIHVTCEPEVRPEQRVALFVGDREIVSEPRAAPVSALTFTQTEAEPGDYLLRIRVDGVDSMLIDYSTEPPSFDQTQRVTLV